MNNHETTNLSQQEPVTPPKAVSPAFMVKIKELYAKVPTPVKDIFKKFYANKKIFWPVTIAFGLLFFTLIIGILFGSRAPVAVKKLPVPTPFVSTQTPTTSGGDVLSQIQSTLSVLKDQINTLDVRQSRLKPPAFNFDIKF